MKLTFAILGAITLVSANAWAVCTAGQLSTLITPFEVSRLENGEKKIIKLDRGTEVHVVAAKSEKIEIWVGNNLFGTYVNGLGSIASGQPVLTCQVN